jgi:glycosyltransferase involved in cell wall biosynthesis
MLLRNPSPWVVFCETGEIRWGGDLRRRHLLEELAAATSAVVAGGWGVKHVRAAFGKAGAGPWPWQVRPAVASSELMSEGAVTRVRRDGRAVLLDVHDHPVIQASALGVALDEESLTITTARLDRNLALFPLLTVPSASFAELAGLDPARTIVAPNGTDSRHITPVAPPTRPAIGMISGAAPGRGVEDLIAAARAVRAYERDVVLHLWLTASHAAGEEYMTTLRESVRDDVWIVVATIPYEDIPAALAAVSLTVIPHPPNEYLDAAVPIKLLDSMAAARPVVATPRTETRRIIEATGAGAIAADGVDGLAEAILPFLQDPELAQRAGAAGRAAVEREYDWSVIGRKVADAVLERAGPDGSQLG